MSIYGKPQRSKPYSVDDTKETLRAKMRRQQLRIAALETHMNHNLLSIRRGLRDFEKSKDFDAEKHGDTVFLWCIVEELSLVTTGKPIVAGDVEEMVYFAGDDDRPAKLFTSEEEAKKDFDGDDTAETPELVPVIRAKYYNVVNVFLTRAAAEKHLKEYRDRYTSPKIVSMFPIENVEFEHLRRHLYFLGENLPDAVSVWEERENVDDLRATIANQAKEIRENDKVVADHVARIEQLELENKKILDIITVKKGKKA